jgi:hypothetical protein
MSVIVAKGTIRHGKIEVEKPIDLPDGSNVVIQIATTAAAEEINEDWDNSPEAIADWLKWYYSLEPLIFTPEEEADTAAWLRKMDDFSAARMDKEIEDLFR